MSENFIEDTNLSLAWARAIKLISRPGVSEQTPLIVSLTGFDNNHYKEDDEIRSALDAVLVSKGMLSVKSVSSTIFPISMWNPKLGRGELFSRYQKMIPKLQSVDKRNKDGLYFQRMISKGPESEPNQLEFVLRTYLARDAVRRSMLQIAIYNPAIDCTAKARLGFPCMQHLTFTPTKNGGLSVNAFYADQFMIAKAYGNYIGLCNLGRFVAHELQLPLERVTCYAGIAQLGGITKHEIAPILQVIGTKIP